MNWIQNCIWTFKIILWGSVANPDPITHEETEEGHSQKRSALEPLSRTGVGDQVVDQCRPGVDNVKDQAKTRQFRWVYSVIYTWSRRGQSSVSTPLSAFGAMAHLENSERTCLECEFVYMLITLHACTHVQCAQNSAWTRICACTQRIVYWLVRLCSFVVTAQCAFIQCSYLFLCKELCFFRELFTAILGWHFKCTLRIGHACQCSKSFHEVNSILVSGTMYRHRFSVW